MWPCVKMPKQRGSALSMTLLFFVVLSALLLSSVELKLSEAQLVHLFYHKMQLFNQAESMLQLLRSNDKAVPLQNINYRFYFDHQDECLNQYYRVEVVAADVLARVYLRVLLVKRPGRVLPGCENNKENVIYEEIF